MDVSKGLRQYLDKKEQETRQIEITIIGFIYYLLFINILYKNKTLK